MKLTINSKKTLRQLILDRDPTIIEKLNPRRITGDGAAYGLLIQWISGTVYCETLLGDVIDLQTEGMPLHTIKALTMNIPKLEMVWFDGDGEILVSFL